MKHMCNDQLFHLDKTESMLLYFFQYLDIPAGFIKRTSSIGYQ